MDPEFPAVGALVDIGSVPGAFAADDPTGRYLATVSGDGLTVYDLPAGLAPVASYRMDPPQIVAVHPGGEAVAVIGQDRSVRLYRSGEPVRTASGLGGTRAAAGSPGRVGQAAWLAFTADGSHLLFGEAAADDGPARLHLLDAATPARLDTTDSMRGHPHFEEAPLTGWGEGVDIACAPLPATAVGFASNAGDDPHVLAVAEIRDGRLRVHDAAAGTPYASQIPGERVNGIAMTADGELLVLDSDAFVTAFSWREPEAGPRRVVCGFELLQQLYGDDDEYQLSGAVFAGNGWIAVEVVNDGFSAGRLTPEPAALAFLDTGTGRYLGQLEPPPGWRADRVVVGNGFLRLTEHGRTRIARWVPPPSGELTRPGPLPDTGENVGQFLPE